MDHLVIAVDRVEAILLEYAPDIAAEVLARVWVGARPSKPVKRPKASPVPVHETGPNEVFPQRCDRCAKSINAGETAWASTLMPLVVCLECVAKRRPDSAKWPTAKVTVVAS